MNRYQSIISAVISAVCIFVVPWLNRKGIIIDETAATTIVAGIIACAAFCWTAWKNHNLTDAAMEAQCILQEIKADDGEDAGEDLDDYEEDEAAEDEEKGEE